MKRYLKEIVLLLILLPFNLLAQCSGITNTNPQPLPQGLTQFYVMDSQGTLTLPASSLSNPTGTSFDSFKSTILANIRTDAIQTFADNWGIVFTGLNTISDGGDWDLLSEITPLEHGKKVLFSGGETVPAAGWVVYQAEWRAVAKFNSAMIPSGTWVDDRLTQLGLPIGSSPIPVQQFTSIAYGIFRITCTDGVSSTPFDVHYTSIRPLFPDIIVNYVNSNTSPDKYNSSRAPVSYYLSLDNGVSWTGQGKGRFELQNLGANYKAVSKLIMKFYTP